MKFYRGDIVENFKVANTLSRYGFPALFFSSDIELARIYAKYKSKQSHKMTGGYVHEFEINRPRRVHDFNFEISHSRIFRNLIHDFKNKGYPSVLIKNVMDYPSETCNHFDYTDICVVFFMSEIIEVKILEKNLTS